MAQNYLHGVETVEITSGARPVQVVKSSIIALLGIAPTGPVNVPTLVLNERDAAQFGQKLPGFNIPKALAAIFAQGSATVVVVNVFDSVNNVANVSTEAKVLTNGKIKLSYPPMSAVSVFAADGTTPSTAVLNTDYTIDAFGNLTSTSAVLVEGTTYKFTYKRLDGGTINSSQLIGTYNSSTGVATGAKLFDQFMNLFGFNPKILIAPGYSQLAAVATELESAATKHRAIALLDAPVGTTLAAVIAGRGPVSPIGGFYTSKERSYLLYPHFKAYDAYSDANENQPYSQFMAGIISATDNTDGYWFSPSNRQVQGVVGVERLITGGINNPQSEANLLNEKGITTVQTAYGTGYRTWGNRSAAFPTSTAPANFISVRRVADVIHESLELAMLPFIDQPINDATIDSISETVNQFFRTLVGRGAIIDGECKFDKAKNPVTEIAAGHLTFDIMFMPPTPAERITFDSFIDINLLKSLGTTTA